MRMLNIQPVLTGKRSSRALNSSGQEHATVDTMYHIRGGIALVEDFRVRNYSYHIERSPFESLQADYDSNENGYWNRILQSHHSMTPSETRVDTSTDINISGSRKIFPEHSCAACHCGDQEGMPRRSSGQEDIAMAESLTIMDYVTSF